VTFSTTTGLMTGYPKAVGTFANIVVSVSDGVTKVSLPGFTIAVVKNAAPTIKGTPATTATVSQAYSFQPTASDPEGQKLSFSIQNKPSWTTFSTSTGKLSGTPTASNVGSFKSIVIRVSDGVSSAALPAYSITVSAAGGNSPPKISGTPATSVNATDPYSFQPTASDPNGDALTFAIANRPGWATFSTSTGKLSGTPTAANVGTYSGIAISVSDGKASAALPGFSIAVTQNANGAVTLSWIPPTQNTDGSVLTNLSGYRIYYGTSPSALTRTITLTNPALTSYVVQNLSPATYYFGLKALASSGTESDLTTPVSKTVN
jgi:hypothetical protein